MITLAKTGIVIVTLLLFPTFFLCASKPPELAIDQASSRNSFTKAVQVTSLYKENCARCHAASGQGNTPLGEKLGAPDFTDADWHRKHSETGRLVASVLHGRGSMPAFAKKLSRAEVQSLVAYIRRFGT